MSRAPCPYQNMPVIKRANWYYGAIHDLGMLWKQWGFLTSTGTLICDRQVNDLLTTILLPSEMAVIKTEAYTVKTDPEYQGNALADRHVKATATESVNVEAHVDEVLSASIKNDLLLPDSS